MDRKDIIKQFFCDEMYVPMKFFDIMAVLSIPESDTGELSKILDELEHEGFVEKTNKGKYVPLSHSGLIACTFRASDRGYGFAVPSDGSDDIFIMSENTQNAYDGDTVAVKVTCDAKDGKKREGKIVKITDSKTHTVVGTFINSRNFGFVIPDSKKVPEDIFISKTDFNGAKNGQKVIVKLKKRTSSQRRPEGIIEEILGNPSDIGIDVLSVLKQYSIREEFPQKVTDEAKSISATITQEEMADRVDLRDEKIFTIDGKDAKDLDDAVSIKTDGDNYVLGVHIADVTHYVKENSPLDREAYKRGTSVYFTDRVVPMLPRELSNGICSLNPREDRLTLSVTMTISPNGELLNHKIYKSIINTVHRMNYDDVTQIIEGNTELCHKYADIHNEILLMNELRDILKKKRQSRGSIDFDFPETKIEVDENGTPTDVYKYVSGVSNSIIEEFMLMANKTVAEEMFWKEAPFIFRIHEKPTNEKIHNFNVFIKNMGYTVKSSKEPHSKEFAKLLNEIKGTRNEMLISKVMLRSLMKARYSHECEGHFGLAFKYYCHFTSPIRRYPDLAIHRIIKEYLISQPKDERILKLSQFCQKAAQHSSECEINAMEAEREVEDMKKAEYMENHVGFEYDGVISSITNFGFYVELENGIEGLVRLSDLDDDYYIFNEQNLSLTGEHSSKEYHIGDLVRIVVSRASKASRQIDFDLV